MWQVIKTMYEASRREKVGFLLVWSGSGYLLYMFSNDLLVEIQEAGLGVQLSSGKIIGELFLQMTLWALVTKTQAKLTIIKAREYIRIFYCSISLIISKLSCVQWRLQGEWRLSAAPTITLWVNSFTLKFKRAAC